MEKDPLYGMISELKLMPRGVRKDMIIGAKLSEIQARRLIRFVGGRTISEIATQQGKDVSTIRNGLLKSVGRVTKLIATADVEQLHKEGIGAIKIKPQIPNYYKSG